MRVSWNWLGEYVDLSGLTPQQVAAALTQAGLEVEGAVDTIGPQFERVVVGRILAIDPHPNADKLRLVTVTLGDWQQQVVCGAPNVALGQHIAFALDGARVFSKKTGQWFTLGEATIRGVRSVGMVCSLEELALDGQYPAPDEPGIWPLNAYLDDAALGQDLKQALKLESDVILHTAPTANRGDLMAYIGIAREVAALFKRELRLPVSQAPASTPVETPIRVGVLDTAVCSAYYGAYLSQVTVQPSPDWVRRRLEASGIRAINAVVDVTNYVMLEMGQPLHAFDADRLGAGTLAVRRAYPDETLATLDGEMRALSTDSLLITLDDKPVALGGVMGGLSTAVADHTKAVFLEAAVFAPALIRKSGRSVGLRSESSARFERGIDPQRTALALYRAATLLQEWTGAKCQWITPVQPPTQNTELVLCLERLARCIGRAYNAETVAEVLQPLGFEVSPSDTAQTLRVTVPSYRRTDVTQAIDLIEEVVRIHGYHQVPETQPLFGGASAESPRRRALKLIHQTLLGLGLQEVMTPSLTNPDAVAQVGGIVQDDAWVGLSNSHSQEHTVMRQSLTPSLLEVAAHNVAQGTPHLWLYELGRVFLKRGKAGHKQTGVQERLQLGLLLAGTPSGPHWQPGWITDFFAAKGVVESLLRRLDLQDAVGFQPLMTPWPLMHPGRAAELVWVDSGQSLGVLAQLHPGLAKRLKLKQTVFVAELNADALLKRLAQHQQQAPQLQRPSLYPPVERDLAFIVPDSTPSAAVLEAMRQKAGEQVRSLTLFDVYTGPPLPEGTRSLAYRFMMQSDTETLTDATADAQMQAFIAAATALPGVALRG